MDTTGLGLQLQTAEDRTAKSGKGQMLHSLCTLRLSLQGSGDDVHGPPVWKTFLVALSLALKHQAPVGVGDRRI